MSKIFKKLISISACMALLMTLVPMTMVSAETTSIAELTIEDVLGHQPANMVTEDLVLPEGYEWTVEPAGVIDTTTGAITKHYVDDIAVALTATDSEGISKTFNLNVKAKTIKMYASDSFVYDYEETTDALSQTGFIFSHHGDGNHNNTHIVSDGENKYLKADLSCTATASNSRIRWTETAEKMESLNNEDVIYIGFDMNYSSDDTEIFQVDAFYSDGSSETLAGTRAGLFRARDVWSNVATVPFEEGRWTPVAIKIDLNSNLVSISVNGSEWVQDNKALSEKTIDSIRIVPGSMSGNCGTLLIDNFVVYSKTVDNLTAEELNTFISSELVLENITNEKASAITKDLNLPTADGLVTWSSTDESVISSVGKVTRGNSIDSTVKSAVLTATYNSGEKVFNFAVVPEKYTIVAPFLADFENGTDGSAITTATVANLANQSAYTGWGKLADSTLAFNYKMDANRGLVAEITNVDGSNQLGFSVGASSVAAHRFNTGFDLNVANIGDSSVTVTMNGAVAYQQLTFTKDSMTVATDNSSETYAITPDANGWIRVVADNNWAARSQNIYVNGSAVTGTLKNMIYTSANTRGVGGDPYRTIVFTVNGSATVLLDNVTAVSHSTSPYQPAIMADAGVKAVQLFYSDRIVGDGTTLEKVGPGPLFGSAADISDTLANQTNSYWTSANISYDGICITEGVFNADNVGEYTVAVTASAARANHYSATATGTVKIKGAPVVIKEVDGKISVSGTSENGVLVIAQYDPEGKMTDAKVYSTFENIAVPEGTYKAFFIKSLSTLVPAAYALEN